MLEHRFPPLRDDPKYFSLLVKYFVHERAQNKIYDNLTVTFQFFMWGL